MTDIAAFCLNPAIDYSSEAERVRPTHKVRTDKDAFDPGGGGVNVARVLKELGAEADLVCLAGGVTGALLDELLGRDGIPRRLVRTREPTRINHVVFERESGREFRFVAAGPTVDPSELDAFFAAAGAAEARYFVASGSLPKGVPADSWTRLAAIARGKGARFVLDTSGEPLRAALAGGGVFLAKPSIGEFEALVGRKLPGAAEQDEAASAFVKSGRVEMLAVSLGAAGALLATRQGVFRRAAPDVEPRSAVGAGDSFLAAMVLALAEGADAEAALAEGVAAGTAAILTPGTGLCGRQEVERMRKLIAGGGLPARAAIS